MDGGSLYVQVGTKRRVCVVNFNLARRPRSTRDPRPNPTRYYITLDPNPNPLGAGVRGRHGVVRRVLPYMSDIAT